MFMSHNSNRQKLPNGLWRVLFDLLLSAVISFFIKTIALAVTNLVSCMSNLYRRLMKAGAFKSNHMVSR